MFRKSRLIQDMYRVCKTMVRSAIGENSYFGVEVGLHPGSAYVHTSDGCVDRGCEKAHIPGSMMFADEIVLCGDDETDMTEYLETWRRA